MATVVTAKEETRLESIFQAELIKELQILFPGCFIIKNDPNYLQGVPDLLVLFEDRWAMLEVKASYWARLRPNQEYYVELLNNMSYSAFIYPENKELILDELQQTFRANREARLPQR